MGVVYRARDERLKRDLAIKVLPPELMADLERKRLFVQEARAASALSHPNIVTIHEIASKTGDASPFPYAGYFWSLLVRAAEIG